MMKKLRLILIVLVIVACDSENVNDCLQSAGTTVQEERAVAAFEKIIVNRDVEMILKQEDEFKVVVESGENLLNDIDVDVVDNTLVLTDNNNCNLVREFGLTKIYVSAPDIKEIRSSTQYDISSEGILNLDYITLLSEDFSDSDSFTTGDFRLEVATDSIRVLTNNLSTAYLSGTTNVLNIFFASGDGRFQGEDLIANSVSVFHRGSNDIVVNPQEFLGGQLVSTGNMISLNQPPVVEVEELFTGQLIFQD